MKVIEKTPGRHVEYETTSKSIIFGDEDLSINLKNREKDERVTIDICSDVNGELTMGVAAGMRYVAQVEIPPREYTEEPGPDDEEGNPTVIPVPVPFDIEKCTLYLWGMED